jgi:branched-chain amino acid aminotransferase
MTTELDFSRRAPSRPEHPNHDAHIGVMTHALHYGTACFEGIRAYWNEGSRRLLLLQGPAHFERLRTSGKILRMELAYSTDELMEITLELIRRNDFHSDVYVRPLLYKSAEIIGVTLHGLPDSFLLYATPMGDYVGTGGIRCMVASWRRIPEAAMPARAKATANYLNSALAKSEALENGYDEAIVLNLDGHVSEGSAENIFIYKDGKFSTPAVTDDILEGVTRGLVIELIEKELGMRVVERSIDRTELYAADEVILCGTGAQISPVIEVDRRKVGDGRIGELAQELQQLYLGAVRGENPAYAGWSVSVY